MNNKERASKLSLSSWGSFFCLPALRNLSQCHTTKDEKLGNEDLAFFPLSDQTAFLLSTLDPFRLDTCHFANSLLEAWTHCGHLPPVMMSWLERSRTCCRFRWNSTSYLSSRMTRHLYTVLAYYDKMDTLLLTLNREVYSDYITSWWIRG